jgi:hypothetical protein
VVFMVSCSIKNKQGPIHARYMHAARQDAAIGNKMLETVRFYCDCEVVNKAATTESDASG